MHKSPIYLAIDPYIYIYIYDFNSCLTRVFLIRFANRLGSSGVGSISGLGTMLNNPFGNGE